jgi:uncharacterized membrane protein YeaQ/YmgE (transglycosylase-associated protein family)
MRGLLLKLLCSVVGYRFHDFLFPQLSLPYTRPALAAQEIRDKARASSAVAGIFMAFLVGLLAALVASEKFDVIDKAKPFSWMLILVAASGALFPFLTLREERRISAAKWEANAWQVRMGKSDPERDAKEKGVRQWHQVLLVVWMLLYAAVFFASPSPALLARALPMSGLFLIVVSLGLLVLSVELYDTAGGWQKLNHIEYHFHMASIASHCYLLGLSATLVGSSLLLCLAHLRAGCLLSVMVLVMLLAMTEIERKLYELAH